jgi:hypothetical protein
VGAASLGLYGTVPHCKCLHCTSLYVHQALLCGWASNQLLLSCGLPCICISLAFAYDKPACLPAGLPGRLPWLQPLPAESTIICEAVVESMEGRKIWLNAKLTDPSGDTVYAASRALFVKPKQAPALPEQQQPQQEQQQQQQQAVGMQS